MKLNVGKVVNHMTRDSYIPIDFVKSRDDYSNFVHNIGIGHVLSQIRPTRHTWLVKSFLVKVMPCRVDVIQAKRGLGDIDLH